MSWVTDVLLCANLVERFDENFQLQDTCAPIEEINSWLKERDLGELADLSTHMATGGKACQAVVYGGSFNHLDLQEFKTLVFSRNWRQPESIRLLINDEDDEAFHLFRSKA